MTPIRILHVIGMMNRGGAETMIMNLYRNIDRTKVQFDFVQNDGPERAFDEEIRSLGGRIFHCPRYVGKNHFAYTKWWKEFFREHEREYTAVHGHIGSTAAIYLSIAKKHGMFTIAHSHSAGAETVVYRLFSYPTRYVADQFFACSAEAAVNRYGSSVGKDSGRCHLLNNAIDTKLFAFDRRTRDQMRNELRISHDTLVIGHVGRFVAVKNHQFLIEVFEQIRKKRTDTKLLLIGDGELRTQIQEELAERNLTDAAILAGIKTDVWNYYQAMDIIVFPSVFEGVPVSLVEAQTAGLPCCVSNGVPRDAAITDLVQFRPLEDTPEQWAQWVLECASYPRRNMTEAMCQVGYDISTTSQWLQNFYLEVVRNRE